MKDRLARWTRDHRNEMLLFLCGMNLILLNFILVHHVTIALRRMEVAVLIFALAYFGGISVGYWVSDLIRPRTARQMMPVCLVTQMALIVAAQPAAYLSLKHVSAWADAHGWPETLARAVTYLAAILLVGLGGTSFYAIFLPAVIESEGGNTRRFYSLEIAGSICGFLLLPLLAGVSHAALVLGYLLAFLVIGALLRSSPMSLACMGALSAVFLLAFPRLDHQTSTWFYRRWYSRHGVVDVLHTRYTPYHKIEVLQLARPGRRMLVLNGKRQFAHGSHFTYSYFVAEYPARLLGRPTVCVLGCGSMSTVGRIGPFVPHITIVDIDRAVFETSSQYFQEYNHLDELTNWEFVDDDAKHFLGSGTERYDLILDDIPPARSRQIALTYTQEFFRLVKARLTEHGLFSLPSLIPLHSESQYGRKMIATMASVFDRYFVLQLGKAAYFYGGGPAMKRWSREELRAAIDHPDADRVQVFRQPEVDKMVAGATIITINNVADLMYDE